MYIAVPVLASLFEAFLKKNAAGAVSAERSGEKQCRALVFLRPCAPAGWKWTCTENVWQKHSARACLLFLLKERLDKQAAILYDK
ncbi:MAG: hypothetical protein DBY17_09785 [Oscillospiraceae bacterium]|nr:MAG: hypothetical protein DBY17_09785 [Oscillospiraceae bacterium]